MKFVGWPDSPWLRRFRSVALVAVSVTGIAAHGRENSESITGSNGKLLAERPARVARTELKAMAARKGTPAVEKSVGKEEESAASVERTVTPRPEDEKSPRPESPLSAFELQLRNHSDPLVGASILQFGYEVFARRQIPLADAPVGPDYVLGAGDSLVVSLWGALVDEDLRVLVDRDGEVRLPQIGMVALKGLSLGDAESVLKRKFDEVYNNYEMELRLGRLRDMPVHVIGRVNSPGRARVSSVATLFDALEAAGGVSKDGTLRSIVLRRRDEKPRAIDLYSYLLEGNLSVDVSLQSNDTVVVPAVGPRVAITGRVLRPAIYEFNGQSTGFDEVLAMAGGYARLADRQRVQIESHLHDGLYARTEDLETMAPSKVRLHDGDVAIVVNASPKVGNAVYLAGNVATPGRYAFREGMRVSDVVTEQALIETGFWLRRAHPGSSDSEYVVPEPFLEYALIRRIQQPSLQESRITFHLGKAIFDKDPSEDHFLQAQDTVVIFPRNDFVTRRTVFIAGPVNKPADYQYFPGMRVRDLVRMAGGLLPEAHLESAMLTRIDPEQDGARFKNLGINVTEAMDGKESANILLRPNDGLSIKTVPGLRPLRRVTVVGEVQHPGTYTVIPGERLSDLLRRAGGFSDDAYLPAVQFYRESVRKLQQERIEESLRRLELEMETAAQRFTAESAALGDDTVNVEQEEERVSRLISTIRSTQAKGRTVIRVASADELEGTPHDVELVDGDRLVVPRRPDEVNVVGAVFNQTALLYQDGLRVRDYLHECGGPTETAEMEFAYVIRADGSTDSAQSARRNYRWDGDRGRYSRGNFLGAELYPGDTVVVPYDVKPHVSSLGLAKTVTQILFQAALATGVVVALM